MKVPYKTAELNGLIKACIEFTDDHNEPFYAGNIGGRGEVPAGDIDSTQRMMTWVAGMDGGILENMGPGKYDITYYRLGLDARQIMKDGGIGKYIDRRKRKEQLENLRIWSPIFISLLALVLSVFTWLSSNGQKEAELKEVKAQINQLNIDWEKTNSAVSALRANLESSKTK